MSAPEGQPTTAPATKGSLSPAANLQDNMQAVGGGILVISANAEAIMNQPLFDTNMLNEMFSDAKVTPVPVNDHLTKAKGYANDWLSKYEQEVLNTLEHTVAYDNKFQNFYGTLLGLAKDIKTGNNLAEFKNGLTLLEKSVNQVVADLQTTHTDLSTYSTDLETDVNSFSADVQSIQSALGALEATKTGAALFSTTTAAGTDLDAIGGDLDQNKMPGALNDLFSANNIKLYGHLVVNMQTKGQSWAINEVSENDDNKSYSVSKVFLVERENNTLNVYNATQGTIANLQATIDADREALRVDIIIIGGGAAAILTGALIIIVGAVVTFATMGATVAVIGAGIAVAGGGIAAVTYASIDYNAKSQNLSSSLAELAEDEQILAILPSSLAIMQDLLKNIQAAEQALGNLLIGWKILQNSMGTLISDLGDMDSTTIDDVFLTDELGTAKDDWAAAHDKAELILCNLINRPPTLQLPASSTTSGLNTNDPAIAEATKNYQDFCAKKLGLQPSAA